MTKYHGVILKHQGTITVIETSSTHWH